MPLPETKYGICLGPWGDVICSLGHFQTAVGVGECIYYGPLGLEVVDFLEAQPFISAAYKIVPKTYEDYQAHVALMWNHDVGVRQQGIALAMQDTPFAGKNIIDTNVNYMYSGYDGPTAPLATGLQTPESCALWAQDVASHLPRPFFLLQPFSINTNKLSDHWPHWHEYVRWLMHDQSKHYVTCGVGWDDSGFQKLSNVTRLVGKTPTVMHLFALADLADGVITTSNSLAHYCAANRLRTVVLAVERNSEPTEYFRKVLHGDNLSFFNKFTSYFRVCWETRTFMDIWPAVEIGTS